jgi:UDPglucose 6-dehydrogenase
MPDLSGASIAVLGLAFKPNTDDIREAPALKLIDALLDNGARVRAFDPAAMKNTKELYGDRITFCKDSYSAVEGTDALVITTEWNEFRVLDFEKVKKLMNRLVLFDCRNVYKQDQMKGMGFTYHSFGR